MRISSKKTCLALVTAFAIMLLLIRVSANAGGPLVVTTDGDSAGWNNSVSVPYITDQGNLGQLSNSDAVTLTEDLFKIWENVSTATISYSRKGSIDVDVDAANFGTYIGPFGGHTAPLGDSVVVYDADGTIFDTLFGVGTSVVGFAAMTYFSDGASIVPIGDPVPPGAKTIEALTFLNGKWIDGLAQNGELTLDQYSAVFVHEFGHFSGLDHTQIHGINGPPDSDIHRTAPVETMFPFLITSAQQTLERDDMVALSSLYPTPGFSLTTGTVTGTVLASDGTPLSGINVIARNTLDDSDAVSYVSGANLVDKGEYTIAGLIPGVKYTIEVQEVDYVHTGGSSVGPFSPAVIMPGPPEFYNGAAEGPNPAADSAAESVPVQTSAGSVTGDIDITLNRQRFEVDNVTFENPVGSGLRDFAVGDFDGDQVIDFVASQAGFIPGPLLRFYRGLGDGNFAPPVEIDRFWKNERIAAGHFNASVDEFLDIVVSGRSPACGDIEIRVYPGDGSGGFEPPVTLLCMTGSVFTTGISNLVVGDLDSDQFMDIAAILRDYDSGIRPSNATVYSWLGSGSGTFTTVTTPLPFGHDTPSGEIAIANVTGSPDNDLIGINNHMNNNVTQPRLQILEGDGTGSFVLSSVDLSAIARRMNNIIATGDFNEDGVPDVAIHYTNPLPENIPNFTRTFVSLLLGDGSGGFTPSARYQVNEAFQFSMIAVDVDSDSHLDIVSTGFMSAPGAPGAKLTVAFGDGRGGIREIEQNWGLAELPFRMAAADFNDDSRIDLLVTTSAFTNARLANYATLIQADPADLELNAGMLAVLGDINANSSTDIAVLAHDITAGTLAATVKDTADGSLIQQISFSKSQKPVAFEVMADINANGAAELVVLHKGHNLVLAEVRDGLTGAMLGSVNFDADIIPVDLKIIADQNGNGIPELAVLGSNPAQIEARDVLTGNLVKQFNYSGNITPKALLVLPDLNGKGGPDIGVLGEHEKSERSDRVEVRDLFTGSRVRNLYYGKLTVKQARVVSDLNHNGTPEVAVLRHSDNGINVLVKDALTGALVRHIGYDPNYVPGELLVVPDVNGNGASELAVFGNNPGNKTQKAQVRDGRTKKRIRNVYFDKSIDPEDLAVMPDINGNGAAEIALLGRAEHTGHKRVIIKDSKTGIRIGSLDF